MKISLNWIKKFVDIPAKYSAKDLAELLTLRTCEVEGYEEQGRGLEGVVIGEILEFHKHPNADKLNVAKVNIGRPQPLNLIFGQMVEMHVGARIPVAVAPTILPTGIEIKTKELRGVKSEGMFCLEQELGFKDTGVSILYFPDTKPGTPLAQALNLNDIVFEIENKSLTHRPDLWGHYGMAREFTAMLGVKLKSFAPKIAFPKRGASAKVTLSKPDIASRFLSAIITNIKVAQSPAWLKDKLQAVGMRPVNNIVDATNYVMYEFGHPLHAFDRRVVENDHFLIRFAKINEKIETIDHKVRTLSTEDALVTNGKKILAIAGIMGGVESEISQNTTEIILEVATWNPVMIRKTSQRHGLRSDAAQRFEKSLDPQIAGLAFKRACELILQICKGAKLAGLATDIYPQKPRLISVLLDPKKVNLKIGAKIPEKEMISILKALEFGVKKAARRMLKVTIPSFRATKDINIEDDLVEEISRMHGYEKIASALPHLPIKLPVPNTERILKHQARQILSFGLGFDEIFSYSFYGVAEIKNCLLPQELHIEIENPLTEDQTHMRISLLPNMLKAVAQNLKWKEKFKIYEIGRSYIKQNNYFPLEEKFICGIIVRPENDKEIFYDALGALQSFLEKFGAKDFQIEKAVSENTPPYSHPSKCAVVKYRGKEIAVIYEIHPQILKTPKTVCAAFEINFTRLVAAGQTEHFYKPIPRFPGIEIDISVLAPKNIETRQIFELIKRADNVLIANISLIDIFSGKSLGEDKKSFTFRVLLQSPDRTLTDAEMKQIQEKIFALLQKAGFSIRGL